MPLLSIKEMRCLKKVLRVNDKYHLEIENKAQPGLIFAKRFLGMLRDHLRSF